jgi:asparagine synthase (glutamine-hydrolysing)
MPKWTRFLSSRFITSFPTSVWDTLLLGLKPLFPNELKAVISGDRLYKLSEIILLDDPKKLYRRLISCWDEPASLINGVEEPSTFFTNPEKWPDVHNFFHWMMYIDMISYLPDDILVKVDRASMGVSLEVRVPIIDHRIVEFSWKIPFSLKVKGGLRKWLLRQVLYKYVPRSLIERPKTGFGIPISEWLRTSIRDWAEELLDERHLKEGGIFNSKPILEKWVEHKNGVRNWHYYLWNILMFQAWLEEN